MRRARGSRTCAQIGKAGRGGASTALIASGSAARQKTRAQKRTRERDADGVGCCEAPDATLRKIRRRASFAVGAAHCLLMLALSTAGVVQPDGLSAARRRSARMRRCSGGTVGGARLPRVPRRGDEHWRAAPTGAASTAARARCGGRGETPSPWYGLRMTWPACGRTCWFPSKDQRGSSKMRGGLQRMIKGGRADAGWRRVGPVRAARRRRRRLPDARRFRRADRSEVSGGNVGPPLGSVVKIYP